MSGAPAFMAVTQGSPSITEHSVTSRACVPGSHGTLTIQGMVLGRLSLPGHCTDSRLKDTPSLCDRPTCLFRSFSLRDRLLVWYIPKGLLRCTVGMEAGDAIFALSLCLAPDRQYLPERNSYTCLTP